MAKRKVIFRKPKIRINRKSVSASVGPVRVRITTRK